MRLDTFRDFARELERNANDNKATASKKDPGSEAYLRYSTLASEQASISKRLWGLITESDSTEG